MLATFLRCGVLGWIAAEWGITSLSRSNRNVCFALWRRDRLRLFLLSRPRRALERWPDCPSPPPRGRVGRWGEFCYILRVVLIAAFLLLLLRGWASTGLWGLASPALCLVFIVTLTLVPALLAVLGPPLFGREVRSDGEPHPGGALLRRPGLVAGPSARCCCSQGGQASAQGASTSSPPVGGAASARGYEELTEEFPRVCWRSVNVLVQGGRD